MTVIEKELIGYLHIHEWECLKCPWCSTGKGSVTRVSKGDRVYTVKSTLSVRKTELCFFEAAIEDYLRETGHDNDVDDRLERLKQDRNKPEPAADPVSEAATCVKGTPRPDDRFVLSPEISERTGISVQTLYNKRGKGTLPFELEKRDGKLGMLNSSLNEYLHTRK
jgi:predicted DNA-binding transcriptional regulator AlpA